MPTPAPNYNDITKEIQNSVLRLVNGIPSSEQQLFLAVFHEITRLDMDSAGNVKSTVANLQILNSVKNKINKLILTDTYTDQVRDYVKSFNEITKLQNKYWKSVEKEFQPSALLREIKNAAVDDTVKKLTESGVGANVSDKIIDLLRTVITTGGSKKTLTEQLRQMVNPPNEEPGILGRYVGQVATDAINQYGANYTQVVSSDLGYEWYYYRGTEIKTSRPFCQAMVENSWFHVSQIPKLLKGLDAAGAPLEYTDNTKDHARQKVKLYSKTGLPEGFYPNTTVQNFMTLRGGYNCDHQPSPANEKQVPLAVRQKVFDTPEYQHWAATVKKMKKKKVVEKKKEVEQKIIAKRQAFDAATLKRFEKLGLSFDAPTIESVAKGTMGFDFNPVLGTIEKILKENPGSRVFGRIGSDRFRFVIEDDNGKELVNMRRTFINYNGKNIVSHDYFVTDAVWAKSNPWVGKKLMRDFFDQYEDMNVALVTVHANIDSGGYVWAKYGFAINKGSLQTFYRDYKYKLSKQDAEYFLDWQTKALKRMDRGEVISLHEIAVLPWGKKFLLGTDWHGTLDMHDPNRMKIFNDYLNRPDKESGRTKENIPDPFNRDEGPSDEWYDNNAPPDDEGPQAED